MRLTVLIGMAIFSGAQALAWDAHGHRTITYLALDGLPRDTPDWLRDTQIRHQIADQSNEPDRWRGSRMSCLHHENKPEHYIDIDDLDQFGLTLDTIPPLRMEYLRAMAIAKHVHPEQVRPYDAATDPDRTKEWPGFLPHAICEQYAKLQASFQMVRILEKVNDPARRFQLDQARANAIYHMGLLSHYVGDAAQPLHTTRHFNGWAGDNPKGYTTKDNFHAFIDGGVVDLHKIAYADLRPQMKYDAKVNLGDPWKDTLRYIRASYEKVEPLYQLEQSGELKSETGKKFISQRLTEAGEMLAAYYAAAWRSSAPDEKQIRDFIRFNNLKPELLPGAPQQAAAVPTSQQVADGN